MFTGIVSKTTKVKKHTHQKGGSFLVINNPFVKTKIGDSILINGVCSTVKKNGSELVFEYMPETLEVSNLSLLKKNDTVNTEQSLRLQDRLDGHIVLGHIDCVGKIQSIQIEGNSRVVKIKVLKKEFMKFLVHKGSVAVDGISLTISRVYTDAFVVKLIPYTYTHTNLKYKKEGSTVNLEFDILAKYANKK